MSYNLGIHIGLACNFWVEKFNKDGVNFKTGPFRNTILNTGLDLLETIGFFDPGINDNNISRYCNIGTGTTAPAVTQTTLANYFTAIQRTSNVNYGQEINPLRYQYTREYQFDIGTFNGQNIGELGLSMDPNSGYFNRQLTRATSSVVDEVIGTGNGSIAFFPGNLTNGSCDTGTLVITAYNTANNLMTLTDDGAGGFTGDGTGAIVYSTGAFSVEFNANVKSGNNVLADYDWQEPTIITVAADEGLRIYAQVIMYAEAELNTNVGKAAFGFDNLTASTTNSHTYNMQIQMFDLYSNYGTFNNSHLFLDASLGARTTVANSHARTFTTTAAGGPYMDIEGTWNPGAFTGDLTYISLDVEKNNFNFFLFAFALDSPETGLVATEEIKITARISWGRH